MCMMYHLGTEQHVPLIPWDETEPKFCSEPIAEDSSAVLQQFSLPNVIYIGSSEGCGCGFRYTSWEGNGWIDVIDDENDSQTDHEALVQFIQENNAGSFVELYACWDGDYNNKAESVEEIYLADILKMDFRFRERGLYRIKMGSEQSLAAQRL